MPAKTEIYTWRLSRATKARLEDAARVRGRSVAQLLDELVTSELDRAGQDAETERERQQLLHNRARRLVGSLAGGRSRRSERVGELVRARLNKRRSHER